LTDSKVTELMFHVEANTSRMRKRDRLNRLLNIRTYVRGIIAILVVAMCLGRLLYFAILVTHMVQSLHMNDFGKFYYSAQLFLHRGGMYEPTLATAIPVGQSEVREFLNMNPPHFHLLILPFAFLEPGHALLLWTILNLVALGISLRLIGAELGFRWTAMRVFAAVVMVLFCSATETIVITGQLTFLLLLPITLAWIAARRGNWNRAALYLGICTSIKPFIGIFLIYLVLARRLQAAATMAAAATSCYLIGLVVFGWQAHLDWLRALSAVDWTWASMNGSLAALPARAFGDTPYYVPILYSPRLVAPITAILALLVIAISLTIFLRDESQDTGDRTFAGLLITAQLVSPLGWVYYLWFVAGPALALWRTRHDRPSVLRGRLALMSVPGLVAPLGVTLLWNHSTWGGITLGSLYVWSTLLLWGTVLADWRSATKFPIEARSTDDVYYRPGGPMSGSAQCYPV